MERFYLDLPFVHVRKFCEIGKANKLPRPINCLAARMVYNGGRGICQNQQKRLGLASFIYFVTFWCQSIAVNKNRSM